MWPNPEFPADFVTFTKEIVNGKLYFLCSEDIYADHGWKICKPAAGKFNFFNFLNFLNLNDQILI